MRLSLSSHLIICYSSFFLFVCMISNNSIFIYIYMQKENDRTKCWKLTIISNWKTLYVCVSLCTFIIVFLIKYKTKTYPLGKKEHVLFWLADYQSSRTTLHVVVVINKWTIVIFVYIIVVVILLIIISSTTTATTFSYLTVDYITVCIIILKETISSPCT